MRLFPFRRPSLGLCFGSGRLAIAEARRGWRRPAVWHCAERPLPAGLLKVTASEPNVTDVAALAKECSALLNEQKVARKPIPASLSLPDLCARTALLEFDSLPHRLSEADALIRWQFQNDTNMPAKETRLTYQTFRPSAARGSAGGPIRVLAVGVRESVIEQYERACELVGVIPVSVGLAGLQLVDLCGPTVESALKEANECFYLYVDEGCLVFLAIEAGGPVFVRVKPLRNGHSDGSIAPPRDAMVRDELVATLQFYMDREGIAGRAGQNCRTLLMLDGEGMVPALPDSLGVSVKAMNWDAFRTAGRPSTAQPFTGLPAVAGIMGA